MQLGKYKEAHVYFQKAVQLGNAPAAFNMGLCYETGAGVPQDFKLVCGDTADKKYCHNTLQELLAHCKWMALYLAKTYYLFN
jgi:TPR repeat protein